MKEKGLSCLESKHVSSIVQTVDSHFVDWTINTSVGKIG